jgi:hypothetical protein
VVNRMAKTQPLWAAVLLAASLTVFACAGGGGSSSTACKGEGDAEAGQAGDQAKSLPEGVASLPADRYATRDFQPTLSFEVGEGWEIFEADQPTLFAITPTETSSALSPPAVSFLNPPKKVSDPEHPEKLVPAPETPGDWVAWFQAHRYLEADEPKRACLGDASGMRFDATVRSSLPEDYYSTKCVGRYPPLWPLPGGHYWCGEPGTRSREIIVEAGNQTVIVDITAPPRKFDEFLPEAQKVLDTVEWQST